MNNKFTQFKNLEASLSEIPQVKPEAHFELNDIAAKIVADQALDEKDTAFLESIYNALQDLEKGIVSNLDEYRGREVISKEEFLITVNYFLIAKQKGPDSAKLTLAYEEKKLDTEQFQDLAIGISMPEQTRRVLMLVYEKIRG